MIDEKPLFEPQRISLKSKRQQSIRNNIYYQNFPRLNLKKIQTGKLYNSLLFKEPNVYND